MPSPQAAPDLVIPCEDRAARLLAHIHAKGDDAERALLERSLGAPRSYPDLYARQISLPKRRGPACRSRACCRRPMTRRWNAA